MFSRMSIVVVAISSDNILALQAMPKFKGNSLPAGSSLAYLPHATTWVSTYN
jgi:hypothetical protein